MSAHPPASHGWKRFEQFISAWRPLAAKTRFIVVLSNVVEAEYPNHESNHETSYPITGD
jgi:hypothetical protein